MEITFEPTEKDFFDSFSVHRRAKTWRKWLVRIVGALILGMIVFSLFILLHEPTKENIETYIPYLAFFIVWFGVILYVPRWNVRRQFLKQPAAHGPRTVTLDEHGIRSRWAGGSSDVEWKNYIRTVEGKDIVLLYFSPAYFNMIPKRAFTPEQWNELRELLKAKIPSWRSV